jgi:hypothetical protein
LISQSVYHRRTVISSEIAGLLKIFFGGEGLPLVVLRHDFLQQIREPIVRAGELVEDLIGGVADALARDSGRVGPLV